jgi:hypothetical protein
MATATKTAQRFSSRRQAPGLVAEFADLFQNLAKALFDPYRPELHYMRGPGPKWHAKHDRTLVVLNVAAMPALVPVRIKR